MQSSSGDWTGNLFDFFFRVYAKLVKDLKIPFKLEGITRIDDTPVHKALREALANCLVNTDFFIERGVVIRKDADKIIMENPGYIRTGKEQMLKGGISDPRNKALMKMFNMIGIGERAGSGVPDIFSVWNKEGWEAPVVTEQYVPDRTILTLSFMKKSDDKKATIKTGGIKISKKMQKQHETILEFMEDGKEYRLADFCKLLNLKETRTKSILKALASVDKIKFIGGNKDRRYIKK